MDRDDVKVGHRPSYRDVRIEVSVIEPFDDFGHQVGDLGGRGRLVDDAAAAVDYCDRSGAPQAGILVELEGARVVVDRLIVYPIHRADTYIVPNTDTLPPEMAEQSSPPLSRESVPDQVFGRLCEAILGGHYQPGERLPTQRALAADLGVNIATVREAVKRLEQLRLVEVRHGDAMRVRDWRQSGGLDALALLTSVDQDVVCSLFESRRLLLSEAARLAARRANDAQMDKIAELAGAVATAGDDHGALLADWHFMAAIVDAAGNIVFQLIMNSVRELYLPRIGAFGGIVAHRDEWAPTYLRAAAAIREGDGDAAAEAVADLALAQERAVMGAAE
jgi:DNA-binding FadR family transcriptional regulator